MVASFAMALLGIRGSWGRSTLSRANRAQPRWGNSGWSLHGKSIRVFWGISRSQPQAAGMGFQRTAHVALEHARHEL